MQFLLKITISLFIIIICSFLGRKIPSLAGLLAVMPLTGVIVLLWIYSENKNDIVLLSRYTKGALLGIFPTVLFYLSAYICLAKKLPLPTTLLISFGIWFVAAVFHQLLSRT